MVCKFSYFSWWRILENLERSSACSYILPVWKKWVWYMADHEASNITHRRSNRCYRKALILKYEQSTRMSIKPVFFIDAKSEFRRAILCCLASFNCYSILIISRRRLSRRGHACISWEMAYELEVARHSLSGWNQHRVSLHMIIIHAYCTVGRSY